MDDADRGRIRSFHDRIAREYEQHRYGTTSVTQLSYVIRRDLALAMLDSVSGRILDVGCGPGPYMALLARHDRTLFAADASMAMIQELHRNASARGLRVAALHTDATALGVRSGSINGAICIGVLGYVPSPSRAVAELHRVLVAGGTAVIQTANAASLKEWLYEKTIPRLKEWTGGSAATGYGLDVQLQSFSKRQLDKLLVEHGFDLVGWHFYYFHVPFLERVSPALAIAVSRRLQLMSRWRCLGPLAAGYIAHVRKRG